MAVTHWFDPPGDDGVDLDRCHEQPTSAFHEAIVVGATTRLRELVELGAGINREGDANPLAHACRKRRSEVVRRWSRCR